MAFSTSAAIVIILLVHVSTRHVLAQALPVNLVGFHPRIIDLIRRAGRSSGIINEAVDALNAELSHFVTSATTALGSARQAEQDHGVLTQLPEQARTVTASVNQINTLADGLRENLARFGTIFNRTTLFLTGFNQVAGYNNAELFSGDQNSQMLQYGVALQQALDAAAEMPATVTRQVTQLSRDIMNIFRRLLPN